VTLSLVRVDDRLIHGQVVVGWGQALGISQIVLVDDQIAADPWEQDLYRMGVPPGMAVEFLPVAEAARRLPEWDASPRRTMLVLGDVAAAVEFCRLAPQLKRLNLGGIHQGPDRRQRLPYVFLSDAEMQQLRALQARGVDVVAQDVPTAKPVPVTELE
jgi:PTS system mannose-specific IIB component/fructoselysine and glucoselysine-specific PTS system IIB component